MNGAVTCSKENLEMSGYLYRRNRPVSSLSYFRAAVLACGLASLAMVASRAADAATFTVTTTADLPGPSCGVPCSLRQAIGAATSAGGDNAIGFAVNGMFMLTTELHVSGSPAQALTLVGNGRSATIIDGAGLARGLEIDAGVTVTLSGLTVRNGNAGAAGNGGGILNFGALTLTNCTVSGSSAGLAGGGISSSGASATLNLANCSITGNSTGAGGGGVRIGTGSALTATHSTISGNSTGNVGGGIVSGGDSVLMITNTTISDNRAAGAGGGGGIATQGQVIVNNSTISNNSADDHGGGIAIGAAPGSTPGMLTLKNSVVSNNVVTGAGKANDGGGINNGSTLIVERSSIVDNGARHAGGGIATEGGAIATIRNSVIAGNSAGHDGGGITNEISGSPLNTVTLTDCAVMGNTARHQGGGIFNALGIVTLSGGEVADNTPDNCSPAGNVSGCTD